MDLSINEGEPGYREFCIQNGRRLAGEFKKIKIFLDGVEQENCTAASEDGGYVSRFATSESGAFAVNLQGECLIEKVHGEVKIILEGDANANPL